MYLTTASQNVQNVSGTGNPYTKLLNAVWDANTIQMTRERACIGVTMINSHSSKSYTTADTHKLDKLEKVVIATYTAT